MARLVEQQIRVVEAEDEARLARAQQRRERRQSEREARELPAGDFFPATFVHG